MTIIIKGFSEMQDAQLQAWCMGDIVCVSK